MGSENCKKCTYDQGTNKNFICHECESNEYLLTKFGECKHCNTFLDKCKECHYGDNGQVICDKCNGLYFPNSEGKCQECNDKGINGGTCYICSVNGTEYDHCYCRGGYVKIGHSECHYCGSGCSECSYDNKTGSSECLRCYSDYVFNSDKKCIDCGERCNYCELDKNNNTICLSCYPNSVLKDGKCLFCNEGCSNCTIDPKSKYKNETICYDCSYNYAFNPENNNCTYCEYIQQLGGEYGCKRCLYNEKSKDYECFECKNDFIHITNDRTCRKLEEIN